LNGGGGADDLFGGAGSDWADYSDSGVGVHVFLDAGVGELGTAQGDTYNSVENVWGSAYNDFLRGTVGTNQLVGAVGSDVLDGGLGSDHLDGGDGYDFAHYTNSLSGVLVDLLSNGGIGGDAEDDTFTSIEGVFGSLYDDIISGDHGNNNLFGESGDDRLIGNNGNDGLLGGLGEDRMEGGIGNDDYFVDNPLDEVIELAGNGQDTVYSEISLPLAANVETLWLTGAANINGTGNALPNLLRGNVGSNQLDGGGGVDTMLGDLGNDVYIVDTANDSAIEYAGEGSDTVRTNVSYSLTAGSDIETLRTTNDNSVAAINLTGNGSGNHVRGNSGNNVINGGGGNDELTGLGGQDAFLFNTTLDAMFNVDSIPDFNVADDTIQLDDAIFSSNLGLGNISSGEFVMGAAAQDANDRIIYNTSTGALYYDSDGNGGAAQIQFAALGMGLALTHLDFLVV
jgi:Ca2+-binding RTX toxin-like protein